MKINFLEPFMAPISGGLRRIIMLANCLAERGHDVGIFVPTDWVKKPKWIHFDGRIRLEDENTWHKDQCDIAVFNLYEQYKLFNKTKAKKKVYYLLHHETLYNGGDDKVYKQKDLNYIAVSSWVAQQIGKVNKTDIPVTLGGTDTEIFKPMDIPKTIDVLGFGNPAPWKGTKDFKEAMAILNKTIDVKYELFYGKNLNQDQVAEYYNKARVFVSASYFEGWNNTALEAMSCGTPLVCTTIGGNADFAVHDKNCLRVEPRNPKVIAEAVEKILTSPKGVGERIAEEGLLTAQELSWNLVADNFEKFINKI